MEPVCLYEEQPANAHRPSWNMHRLPYEFQWRRSACSAGASCWYNPANEAEAHNSVETYTTVFGDPGAGGGYDAVGNSGSSSGGSSSVGIISGLEQVTVSAPRYSNDPFLFVWWQPSYDFGFNSLAGSGGSFGGIPSCTTLPTNFNLIPLLSTPQTSKIESHDFKLGLAGFRTRWAIVPSPSNGKLSVGVNLEAATRGGLIELIIKAGITTNLQIGQPI